MAYAACLIANHLLDRGAQQSRAFTAMQLLRLVYIAHGFHLAYGRGPLIDEAVEATRYGPVIASLYRQVKRYGGLAVTEPLPTGPFWWMRESRVDTTTAALLDSVLTGYGGYSGVDLAAMTHQPGTPWWTVWNDQGGRDRWRAHVDDPLIEAFYRAKLDDVRAGWRAAIARAVGEAVAS